ncbi:uncharacterized protein METZ01_LOCUS386092 [marine metagenome]|uniref:Uncharacterized protein n=1 Tax=marine metagenome TaxID=408172 RepID=A0A382UHR1_9ZZZZ
MIQPLPQLMSHQNHQHHIVMLIVPFQFHLLTTMIEYVELIHQIQAWI